MTMFLHWSRSIGPATTHCPANPSNYNMGRNIRCIATVLSLLAAAHTGLLIGAQIRPRPSAQYCEMAKTEPCPKAAMTAFLEKGRIDNETAASAFASRCPEPNPNDLPIPVILMSRGRSGSSSIWQIMCNLTYPATATELEDTEHETRCKHSEYTGENTDKNMEFFRTHDDETWLIDTMCKRRREHPSAGIVGTKWKIVDELLVYNGVKSALQFIRQSHHPEIKVIRNRRNALDFVISSNKHKLSKNQGNVISAHCEKGDKECLGKHLNASKAMNLPTKNLLSNLKRISQQEDGVDRYLQEMGIPHVSVSYERLYSGDETALAEWRRVFEFIGTGPTDNLTPEQLQNAMETEVTHLPLHNQTLSNYNEVKNMLTGTEYECLLH
eukprot:CAMPEP_0183297548 /NCGR_PEP_ID=MMETSP0160_2-20130417/4817_1 /TAXON_ID=2839 ORGANISM="Odontella Sinensis, Strain Grunow 1884" /NCGR_SAMPLE_ID=MMETSP0160_2 /ASSEMBLY_ACC=CAM_ASM_000250 /LENGTH=382 /DNA_ID=CAMNT_0025459397 /DNA_START=51 /DNA_END=1199 /DNA_ORIENTATION=+